MSHLPNELDIKTDLRRSVMASFSPKKFADTNFVAFVNNAQKNLELLKEKVGKRKYTEVKARIVKSKDTQKPIRKRREDLLTASSLI
jgi:hypothetical protein